MESVDNSERQNENEQISLGGKEESQLGLLLCVCIYVRLCGKSREI